MPRLINPKSMANRLILAGMAIILLNASIQFGLLDRHLRQDLTELTSNQLLTLANYVAAQIDRDLVKRRELLRHVAGHLPPALLDDRIALHDRLAEHQAVNPLFSEGLVVLNESGRVVADHPPLLGRDALSLADSDYFRQAIQGEFVIGRPLFSSASKAPVLPMAVPLRDADGQVRAVLVGVSGLKSANFVQALYDTRVGATGGFVLVSPRDQLFLGSSDLNITLTPTPKEGIHHQHDMAMQGFRGVGIDVNAAGVEELAAIASVPTSGWFLVARIPTREWTDSGATLN
jgi:diguanylate cyclase